MCLFLQKGHLSQVQNTVKDIDDKVPEQVRNLTEFRFLRNQVTSASSSASLSENVGEQFRKNKDGTIWLFSKVQKVSEQEVAFGLFYFVTSEPTSEDEIIGIMVHNRVFVKNEQGHVLIGRSLN